MRGQAKLVSARGQIDPREYFVRGVAVGTGTGDSVIWMVQDGPAIAYIQVPAGPTPPPDSVSAEVGDLLLSNLAEPRTNPAGGERQKSGEPVTSSSSATATR